MAPVVNMLEPPCLVVQVAVVLPVGTLSLTVPEDNQSVALALLSYNTP